MFKFQNIKRNLKSDFIIYVFVAFVYIVYAYFCWLMLGIMLQYIPFKNDSAFLLIKQDVIIYTHYKIAFITHVFSSILVLPAGFTQFSKKLRTSYPNIHRGMGWLYIIVVLGFAAPSGLWIGFFANGGIYTQIAFCLLAILWFYFTVKALLTAKSQEYHKHKNFMIRSFALALSAITLRAWKFSLVYLFHPHPMDVYRVVAWLGWILNLLIAEIIILKLNKS